MSILERINSPADVKALPHQELPLLASEIRKVIVDVVSKTGGHLASSLGVVELSIALHYVFHTPEDKLIWDVGHQSYAHKLLTGRRNSFHTLRQHEGISGFTRISESVYDAFSTGHASTSISAGLGVATAMELKRVASKVIAVIGDGSLTAGIAYEGLNQAGDIHKNKNLIVILNDNDMSITQNVGALSSFLSRTFSRKYIQGFRNDIRELFKSVPKIGDNIYKIGKRSKESFKTFFVTPGMLFEAFNFEYFGPIDGHNLDHLIEILENIKDVTKPVLLHVTTTKGKGYLPAEKNPVYFHGVGCFEVETGNSKSQTSSTPTYTKVFGNTMVKLASDNAKIVAVTAAMPEGTGLAEFSKTYPARFYDVGIAEQHGVTFAAGIATEGFKPVVAIYSTFLQRGYDQVLHDVCLEALPVVFALDRGGIVGEDGPTHHGLFDFSFLRSLPNMIVMAPKDENELCRMLVTAINHNGPIAFRYPRGQGVGCKLDENPKPLSMGKGEILTKGEDILILSIGSSVSESLKAYDILLAEGIHATVVNARFVKPLDTDLINSLAKKIPRIITVEEHMRQGGFGSAVLECLADHDVKGVCLERIGVKDSFVEHGPQDILRKLCGLDAQSIAECAIKMMQKCQTQREKG